MTEIINLRRARKDKARAEKEASATANRAAFGRTKADKQRGLKEMEAAKRNLDGHKRDDVDG